MPSIIKSISSTTIDAAATADDDVNTVMHITPKQYYTVMVIIPYKPFIHCHAYNTIQTIYPLPCL